MPKSNSFVMHSQHCPQGNRFTFIVFPELHLHIHFSTLDTSVLEKSFSRVRDRIALCFSLRASHF